MNAPHPMNFHAQPSSLPPTGVSQWDFHAAAVTQGLLARYGITDLPLCKEMQTPQQAAAMFAYWVKLITDHVLAASRTSVRSDADLIRTLGVDPQQAEAMLRMRQPR